VKAEVEAQEAPASVRRSAEPAPDRKPGRRLSARELLQARRDLARQQYEAILERTRAGRESDPAGLYLWSRRWMEAEQELARHRSGRIAAAEAHVGRIRTLRDQARARYELGVVSSSEAAEAEYHYLEAEQRLQELNRR
jgi:hypothetical protein